MSFDIQNNVLMGKRSLVTRTVQNVRDVLTFVFLLIPYCLVFYALCLVFLFFPCPGQAMNILSNVESFSTKMLQLQRSVTARAIVFILASVIYSNFSAALNFICKGVSRLFVSHALALRMLFVVIFRFSCVI